MKSFLFASLTAAALSLAATLPAAAQATHPVVTNPISDVTVPVGTKETVVKLKKSFGLDGVSGPLVRFNTSVGTVDVELLQDSAPQTVATFLQYANGSGDNAMTGYTYSNTLIQRAVTGFIVQGGGFFINSKGSIDQIVGRPTIPSEAGVSNTRGTLAMALSNGPDSATGDFFFNIADNAMLDDTSDGGPFTVFGRVIAHLDTVDKIAALPNRDFSTQLGGGFSNVPLQNFDGTNAGLDNLVKLNNIVPLSLLPTASGAPSALKLKLKGNTNPTLVTSAAFKGNKLILEFGQGVTGSSTISVAAKDSSGNRATTAFTVTVQ